MTAWTDWIGRTETHNDILTQGVVTRLRATIDSDDSGPFAPQGIHWCLCLPVAPTRALGADGHPRRDLADAFLPPIPLPRRMWASSTVRFHGPIAVGAVIERTSTIASISEKSGSSGLLAFVDVQHDTRADGRLAVSETQSIVYREGTRAGPPFVAPRPGNADPDPAEWPHVRTLIPDEVLLLRYSALTFNAHRIHYDLPYAREAEGYAGLVVHGPLTATLLLDHSARLVGANRLSQFTFRGIAPAFAGEQLALVARETADGIELAAIGPTGDVAMRANALI